jgi:uncharacterized protein YqgC (DUF456 family)
MDVAIVIFGVLLLIAGVAGCIIPGIPGPPLAYLSLLLQQLKEEPPFTLQFMLIWAGITAVVTVLDYIVPAAGAKRFGSSKQGIWGAVLGLIAGIFFFPPVGIIIGPVVGALVGEFIAGKKSNEALRSAFGTIVGFITGIVLKLIAVGVMGWYFFSNLG